MDRQFWRIYHNNCRVVAGTHQHATVANGQRQRRFRSRLANRYCPDILRAANADFNTDSYSHAESNSDSHCDGDGNAECYNNSHSYAYRHPNRYARSDTHTIRLRWHTDLYSNRYSYAYKIHSDSATTP